MVLPKTAILTSDTNANDELKLKQAFAQILANNTGVEITSILKNPIFLQTNIKAGVKRSYFEKIESKYIAKESLHRFWFHVLMKEKFIKDVMRQANFPILPANEQKLMVWLAEEIKQEDTDELKYGFNDEVIKYWIEHWAEAFAITLNYPDMDEQDMLQVSPQSIKNLSYKAVRQTKNRYNQKHALMVYSKITDDNIKVRTGIIIKNTDVDINFVQNSFNKIEEVYFQVMQDVAQKMANTYKIPASSLQNQTLQFIIKNLNSYDEVQKVINYLNNLSIIESFSITSASADKLVINVNSVVNTSTILALINADDILSVDENGAINRLEFYLSKSRYKNAINSASN